MVATNLGTATNLLYLRDGSNRVLITNKEGYIKVLENGKIRDKDFADLNTRITAQDFSGFSGIVGIFVPPIEKPSYALISYSRPLKKSEYRQGELKYLNKYLNNYK